MKIKIRLLLKSDAALFWGEAEWEGETDVCVSVSVNVCMYVCLCTYIRMYLYMCKPWSVGQ